MLRRQLDPNSVRLHTRGRRRDARVGGGGHERRRVVSAPGQIRGSHVRIDVALHRRDRIGNRTIADGEGSDARERRRVDRALALRPHDLCVPDIDHKCTEPKQDNGEQRHEDGDGAVIVSAAHVADHVHQPQPPGGEPSSPPRSDGCCWPGGGVSICVTTLERMATWPSWRGSGTYPVSPWTSMTSQTINCWPGVQPAVDGSPGNITLTNDVPVIEPVLCFTMHISSPTFGDTPDGRGVQAVSRLPTTAWRAAV